MNKPAPKEPSMDEILSSIRQIIADDDAGTAPRRPAAPPAAPQARSFAPPPSPEPEAEVDSEPLALSAEQILRDTAAEDMAGTGVSFSEVLGVTSPEPVSLVDPDDIAFEVDRDEEPVVPLAPPSPPPVAVRAAPVVERPTPRPAVAVAQAAPLPDPKLTADLAEQLLEPATQSIVKSSFARLNNMSMIGANLTIEQMMREMLRPMLKEWLDENLPAVVERIVEQEIARVSRGGR